MIGRTWLQQALPITLGLKFARLARRAERHRERLLDAAAARAGAAVRRRGGHAWRRSVRDGAAGRRDARRRTRSRDARAAVAHASATGSSKSAACSGMLTGTLGKIARDISLLDADRGRRTREPAAAGRAARRPCRTSATRSAARRCSTAAMRAPGLVATVFAGMVQEHERALGGWHAEWEALPELAILAAGALTQSVEMIAGLEIDAPRMRANLDATNGLIMAEAVTMALGAKLGRLDAHHLVEAACRRAIAEQRHLRAVLADDATVMAELDGAALDRLFDPMNYLGVAESFVDRVLAARAKGD